tara:strand:- start:285 stop:392 length:108 start_codon:yes stop_codon:yes gene_type:complete
MAKKERISILQWIAWILGFTALAVISYGIIRALTG